MAFKLIGAQGPEGTYEVLETATGAAEAEYCDGTHFQWDSPEPGRHVLWVVHSDEGLRVRTSHRVVEEP